MTLQDIFTISEFQTAANFHFRLDPIVRRLFPPLQMESMGYTLLEPHSYDNVLVINTFVQPLILHVHTYVRT